MRWCFWTEMEELGRMEARVIEVLDRIRATVVTLSSGRLDGRILLSGMIETGEGMGDRIEALLRKIEGMRTVMVAPEAKTTRRMIALLRILSDITDRAEILHLVQAVGARAIQIRPSWVAFEMVGTPEEVEGVYQSAQGYGIVDVVSLSCAFMTAKDGQTFARDEDCDEEPEATPA